MFVAISQSEVQFYIGFHTFAFKHNDSTQCLLQPHKKTLICHCVFIHLIPKVMIWLDVFVGSCNFVRAFERHFSKSRCLLIGGTPRNQAFKSGRLNVNSTICDVEPVQGNIGHAQLCNTQTPAVSCLRQVGLLTQHPGTCF